MYLSGGFLTLLGYLDVTCLVGVSFAVIRAGSGRSFSEGVRWFSCDPSFISGVQISGHSITGFQFTMLDVRFHIGVQFHLDFGKFIISS